MAAVFGSDAPATAYSYAYSLRQRVQVHVPAPSTNAALVENTKPTQAIIMPPKAISSARRKPAIIPTQMPPRPTVIPHGIITPPPSSPAAGLIGKSSPEREDADDREPGAARIHEFKSSPDRENGNEFATAGAICEIDVALQDPPHLVRLLRDYLDESLPQYQQKPLALVGLDPPKFEQLCKDLAPELERSRLRLDYDANQGTWILQRASGAHEAGAAGWGHMVDILKTMDMPRTAYRRMIWTGGQPDIKLTTAAGAAAGTKTPDASVRFSRLQPSSMVLETGLSESMPSLHRDAQRLLQGGCNPADDSGLQCVILLRVHPAAMDLVRRFNSTTPTPTTDSTTKAGVAMTIEIWRNARDEKDNHKLIILGLDKRGGGSGREHTNPILVSKHIFTLADLRDEFIPAFIQEDSDLAPAPTATLSAAAASQAYQGPSFPPIPRNMPLAAQPAPVNVSTPYFTIYCEDLLTQSQVPAEMRERIWVNVPFRVFVDAFVEEHARWILPVPGVVLGAGAGAGEGADGAGGLGLGLGLGLGRVVDFRGWKRKRTWEGEGEGAGETTVSEQQEVGDQAKLRNGNGEGEMVNGGGTVAGAATAAAAAKHEHDEEAEYEEDTGKSPRANLKNIRDRGQTLPKRRKVFTDGTGGK